VLADRGLDVVAAKVQTLGEQVVDVFYVRETDGAKPVDPARLAALREALEAASRPVEGGA
jgi:UTP:GlnB (protein PII) uridylyltransferase